MKYLRHMLIFQCILFLAGCDSKEKKLTAKEIQLTADSIFNAKRLDIDKAAQEDLEQRKAIEVKAIADSIVNVRKYGVPPSDPSVTTTPEEIPMMDTTRSRIRRQRDSLRRYDTMRPMRRASSKQLMPSNR